MMDAECRTAKQPSAIIDSGRKHSRSSERKSTKLERYLVYSINDDGGEDESYCDLVLARSPEDAQAWVAKARPYAIIEDSNTCTVEEHLEYARKMIGLPAREIRQQMRELLVATRRMSDHKRKH